MIGKTSIACRTYPIEHENGWFTDFRIPSLSRRLSDTFPLHNDKQQRSHPEGRGETYDFRAAPGGARRDRTDDLKLAKLPLSQLSYGPDQRQRRLGESWWAWEDLNLRPHAYQARALTN